MKLPQGILVKVYL